MNAETHSSIIRRAAIIWAIILLAVVGIGALIVSAITDATDEWGANESAVEKSLAERYDIQDAELYVSNPVTCTSDFKKVDGCRIRVTTESDGQQVIADYRLENVDGDYLLAGPSTYTKTVAAVPPLRSNPTK